MLRRRPAPHRSLGAVACLGIVLLTGCGTGAVEVDSPELSSADAEACSRLADALPDAVSDQDRREVEPEDAYAAAWGDPPIVLRCGVPMPAGFDEFSTCQVANGVGWFVPEGQVEDQGADVVATTVGRAQNVELRVPAEYRPPAAAFVDVADAVDRHVRELEPCV